MPSITIIQWLLVVFFLLDFVCVWTIFKVFIEFVTILLLFYVLVYWPRGMWHLSSLFRDQTCTPCIGRQSFNHWTTREAPTQCLFEFTGAQRGEADCPRSHSSMCWALASSPDERDEKDQGLGWKAWLQVP